MKDKRTTRHQTDDKMINKVRKVLLSVEPRILPTETRVNGYGFTCWVCPYCGELVHLKTHYRSGISSKSYSQFNMHFARQHATPFWKEKQIIKLIEKESKKLDNK